MTRFREGTDHHAEQVAGAGAGQRPAGALGLAPHAQHRGGRLRGLGQEHGGGAHPLAAPRPVARRLDHAEAVVCGAPFMLALWIQ